MHKNLSRINPIKLLLAIWIACLTVPSYAQTVIVQVVGVLDGDTVLVLDEHKTVQFKVRLDQIDAPEKAQPYGQVAKLFLSDLIYKKRISLLRKGQDRYGRTIGEISLNGENINLRMVREGYAWAYRQYVTDQRYIKAEQQAAQLKKGLWLDPNPTPPWLWRRNQN